MDFWKALVKRKQRKMRSPPHPDQVTTWRYLSRFLSKIDTKIEPFVQTVESLVKDIRRIADCIETRNDQISYSQKEAVLLRRQNAAKLPYKVYSSNIVVPYLMGKQSVEVTGEGYISSNKMTEALEKDLQEGYRFAGIIDNTYILLELK